MKKLLATGLLICSPLSLANWTLTDESDVTFLSTKNTNITEVHHFRSLTGKVTDKGKATVSIDLSSADTGIPIRDERLLKMLFEVTEFPKAEISAVIPEHILNAALAGKTSSVSLPVQLNFHGVTKTLETEVLVMPAMDKTVAVVSTRPVLLKAEDFGVAAGVEALRNVAGLKEISATVPVSFNLLFSR